MAVFHFLKSTSLTYTSIDVTPVMNVFEAMMAGSLGVRDSESCWFTEEIGTYMCWWESPHDLPLMIEIFVSFRCAPLAKRHEISITRGRSPGLSQERICKNLAY